MASVSRLGIGLGQGRRKRYLVLDVYGFYTIFNPRPTRFTCAVGWSRHAALHLEVITYGSKASSITHSTDKLVVYHEASQGQCRVGPLRGCLWSGMVAANEKKYRAGNASDGKQEEVQGRQCFTWQPHGLCLVVEGA